MKVAQLPGVLGLLHVVFSAYNQQWRHIAMNYIQGADRLGVLALDALLGQFGTDDNKQGTGLDYRSRIADLVKGHGAGTLSLAIFGTTPGLICRYGAMGQGSIMGHHAPANRSGRTGKRPPDRQRRVQRV